MGTRTPRLALVALALALASTGRAAGPDPKPAPTDPVRGPVAPPAPPAPATPAPTGPKSVPAGTTPIMTAPGTEVGPAPTTGVSGALATPEEARRSQARALVASVPEIGQCKRERLSMDEARKKVQATPELEGDRAEFMKVAERFYAIAEEYREEVDNLLDDSFKERMAGVNDRYDKQSRDVELSERERRNDAIRQFERFVAKYPTDPRYTPDAMFRLAELYYERSAVDYDDASKEYNAQKALYDRGKIPERPTPPVRGFDDVVKTYLALIKTFGDQYRYADAVYYLLGYVQEENQDDVASRKTWMQLIERYPQSEYAPEVWLRIGESHFDYGEFPEAAEAYSKALAYTESRFYDKALYKLAWTWFQMFDYDRAIRAFKQLIAWYDSGRTEKGATASALREEAIDYLARSLAEDDWDHDGEDDGNRGVDRALSYLQGGTSWETDIIERYAEVLYELHDIRKYQESTDVYRRMIEMNPTALAAVEYQQRIIRNFDVLRDIASATRERQRLADMFAPRSAWALANAAEAKRIAEASETVELEMRRRALSLHQRAQELKTEAKVEERPELLDQSLEHYKMASKAYRDYLTQYPSEPQSYEMRFYLAETLFYSAQFKEAAGAYLEVASDPYQGKFREPAAWSAVKAYERLLVTAVDEKRIPDKSNPAKPWQEPTPEGGEQGSEIQRFQAEPYPQEVQDWMQAVDFFVLRDIRQEGSEKPQVAFAYQAATLAMRFKDYEDAKGRFRQVLACFPDDDLAADAMANILNMYRDENDLQNLERWATIADRVQLGNPEIMATIKKRIQVFKLGAQFQRAETLLAEGKHLEAAKEFERLADQNQEAKFLDKAYYNAAMAYKEVKYYDSAARIFEKLVTDPRFAQSDFKTESVFELAENYKLFFSFDKAAEAYFLFLQRTEAAKDKEPNRPYALYTAARLQEYAGNLKAAAATYERYAETFKDRDDSSNAIFRAAELYDRLKDRDGQRRTLNTFITRFSDKQGMGARVIEAMMELADLAAAQQKTRDAAKLYNDILREFQVRGFQPGTPSAAHAAKAKFMLVEQTFAEYVKLKLTGTNQRRMTADLARKKKMLEELDLAYSEVVPFRSLDWTIATFYRLGDLYRDFAQTLYKAPTPTGLSDDELDAFTNMIEDEGLKYENVAVERFERCVVESRRLKVTTDWARKALEAINAYKPKDYPLYKETKRRPTFAPKYGIDARVIGVPTRAAPPAKELP
ncbi:MAG: tetratricopeptide repeat protein [Deltaproteobacteria bacterium]|nr:tetratricopeptide repeat protein [Deltaproteobacteria bacterium]